VDINLLCFLWSVGVSVVMGGGGGGGDVHSLLFGVTAALSGVGCGLSRGVGD
jgi:hypothetical protein